MDYLQALPQEWIILFNCELLDCEEFHPKTDLEEDTSATHPRFGAQDEA